MHTCEALILKTVRYRARDQVVTAFSGKRGLFSFFMKGAKTRLMLEPLMLCELVTSESKGELEKLVDVSILGRYEQLRQTLSKLKVASQIASLLLKTQLPLKPAPALYICMLAHFRWLAKTEKTLHVLASFLIKLLKCEGLIKFSKICTQCKNPAVSVDRGESVCQDHLGPFNQGTDSKNLNIILKLYELKTFEMIETLPLSDASLSEVYKLFEEQTEALLKANH